MEPNAVSASPDLDANSRSCGRALSAWRLSGLLLATLSVTLMTYCRRHHTPDTPEFAEGDWSAAIVGVQCTCQVTVNDYLLDSISSRIKWDDGTMTDWSPLRATLTWRCDTHTFLSRDSFFVRAQIRDRTGALSEWSQPLMVVTFLTDSVKWAYRALEANVTTPAIGEGHRLEILFSTDGNKLEALDVLGRLSWTSRTILARHNPPALGDHVYRTDYRGVWLCCSDRPNPEYPTSEGWRLRVGHLGSSAPALAPDFVYVGNDSALVAVYLPERIVAWCRMVPKGPLTSPVVDSAGTIYAWSSSDDNSAQSLYAFNPSSVVKWQVVTGPNHEGSPAIGPDGTIYVASPEDYLYAINPEGEVRWRYPLGSTCSISPAIDGDGVIYLGSGNSLCAVNSDGSERWRYAAGGPVRYTPAITARGLVCFTCDDSCLYVLRPDGTLRLRTRLCDRPSSAPVIGRDQTAYLGTGNGWLTAVQLDDVLAAEGWPTFQHDIRHTGRNP